MYQLQWNSNLQSLIFSTLDHICFTKIENKINCMYVFLYITIYLIYCSEKLHIFTNKLLKNPFFYI
jgi:hypothetical protein